MSKEDATAWVHAFKGANYFFPVLGAIIADVFFGKYLTIMSLSMVYCAGHWCWAFLDAHRIDPKVLLGRGLFLIALGSGGIKRVCRLTWATSSGPEISTCWRGVRLVLLLHQLWRVFSSDPVPVAVDCERTRRGICGLARRGPFGIPGVLMGVATLLFWIGRRNYAHIPPGGRASIDESFSATAFRAHQRPRAPVPVHLSIFFALYDQTSSAGLNTASGWIACFRCRYLEPSPQMPSQLQSVNAIFVMTMIPLFTFSSIRMLGSRPLPCGRLAPDYS